MVKILSRGFDDDKIPDFWNFIRDWDDDYYILNIQNEYASKTLTLHLRPGGVLSYKYVTTYAGVVGERYEGSVGIDKDTKTLSVHILKYGLGSSVSFRHMVSEFFGNAVMYPYLPTLKRYSLHALKYHIFPRNSNSIH